MRQWWRDAVFYQIYPRSFADSNGDGVGDLDGIHAKLGYLRNLGVNALWLCPVMRSPMADGGYDVSDPRDIDPLFGDLAAMDRLLAAAHAVDLRVTMDLVPNHTSEAHPWFQQALAAAPGSPERERYHFADNPNNWPSVFGGPAWTQVPDGQSYLHLFSHEQPDLNWDNPEVFDDLARTLRFWLDRGVDGFRIDVAHGMAKPDGLPDVTVTDNSLLAANGGDLRFDNDQVHEVHRKIRAVLDEYDNRVTVGEVWVSDPARFSRYVRPDELHLAFNFALAQTPFDAAQIHTAITKSLAAVMDSDSPPTWTLSNHDVNREVSRYGGGARGLARARAMALLELALPGPVFVYNGSELGLPNVDDLPEELLQDPTWERSGHTDRGRDGCRVPMPWDGDTPPFGFTTGTPWLPMPTDWSALTVAAQQHDPASTLSLYRAALTLHRDFVGDDITWLPAPPQCLAFRRGDVTCLLNAGSTAVPTPEGTLILASGPLTNGGIPADTAAWIRTKLKVSP